jgi:hypothetical protein
VGGQAEPFSLGSVETYGDAFSFSCTGFYDTRYTVEYTTNLMEDFVPLLSNAAVTASSIIVTGTQSNADRIFYRMKLQ